MTLTLTPDEQWRRDTVEIARNESVRPLLFTDDDITAVGWVWEAGGWTRPMPPKEIANDR